MSAIEILLFLFLAYYFLRMIARVVLPMLFQGIMNKATQQGQQQQNYTRQRQQPRNNEGSVRVDKMPHNNKSSIPDSEGDYIDYEEI